MHDAEQSGVAGHDPGALRPQQLGRVGVHLLRHDARSRGEGLVELAEAELAAGPDHDFRTEPREVHRAGRGSGQVVEDEVAVGGAVDRVVGDVLEAEVGGDRVAVDLPVDPGECAGAERHHAGAVEGELEAEDVAGEHPEIGEQVVSEVYGLGALEVGVAGHRPVAVGLGEVQQALHRRAAELDRSQRVRLDDHRHVGRNLVVAGATGVELAGERANHLAEQSLDRPCGCPRRPPRIRSRGRRSGREPAPGRRRSGPAPRARGRRSPSGRGRGPAIGRYRRAPVASRTRSSD